MSGWFWVLGLAIWVNYAVAIYRVCVRGRR